MPTPLKHLIVLDALLRTRSPTAAAVELGVTQSAVSKILAALRVELGDQLLLRRGDRMIPTPLAERLAAPLAGSLRDLQAVLRDARSETLPSVVTVAMRDQFSVTLGPALLRAIAELSQQTQLRITSYDRERVSDDLAAGAIDVAIAVDPPDRPGLLQTTLYKETFVCLCPDRQQPTLRAYLAAQHVATTAHAGYVGIDAALAKQGHRRNVVAYVPYFAVAVHLADQERLYVTLPSRVAAALPTRRLIAHPVPIEVPGFTARMLWDARVDRDSKNRWIRKLLRVSAQADAPG
jgi:DNA-binding transcriptional LysR family regulator